MNIWNATYTPSQLQLMLSKHYSRSRYIGIAFYQASIQAPNDNTREEGQKATQRPG